MAEDAGSPPNRWLEKDSLRRRLLVALGIYLTCTAIFMALAGPDRLTQHTPFNHYAHLADAWLHGRHDLRFGAPRYAQGNDFAEFGGKTYISFPPFPAVLMLPFVKLAKSPENFRDGQFVIGLAGLGPAILFLVLERLRRTERSPRTERQNVYLSLLFALGTVYFFVAVEGTVWFAAHVVGVALLTLYLLFAIDARRPLLAGTLLACAWLTRPPMLLAAALFAFEAIRVATEGGIPLEGSLRERAARLWARLDKRSLLLKWALFALPILVAFGLAAWMNHARYGDASPFAMGHEHLRVAWKTRMADWGLFSYHYFPKNLGIMLSSLPWLPPKGQELAWAVPFKINEHGLALWFTTPLYAWLLWPKKRELWHAFLWIAALGPCLLDLMYQNSGWRQFGYRFSNDYAPILFVLLAVGGRSMGGLFHTAALWGLAWNTFGAATFDKAAFDKYYYREGTQSVVYQPD